MGLLKRYFSDKWIGLTITLSSILLISSFFALSDSEFLYFDGKNE